MKLALRVIFQLIAEVNLKEIVCFVSRLICFFSTEKSPKYSDHVSWSSHGQWLALKILSNYMYQDFHDN